MSELVLPQEGGSLPWYALHVRSNHEFIVRRALDGQDLANFLPSYHVRRGTETIDRPLFPGYLFARFDVRNRLPIMKISGLLSILGGTSGPLSVADSEVESLRQLAGAPGVTPHAPVHHGQRVRVKYGPLIGCEGVVEYQKGACRVVVNVPMLGRAAAVHFERDAVEPI